MKLLLCCEGARADSGGVGLVAVPQLAQALAGLEHTVVLDIFGAPMLGAKPLVTADLVKAWQQPLSVFTYPAVGRYEFSAQGFSSVMRHAAQADFIFLHSLYSFSVLSGFLATRRYGKKYALYPHGVLAPFQRRISAYKKAIYNRLIARRILDEASVLIYTAPGERIEAAGLKLRAPSVIVPHGVDARRFARMPERGAFRARHLDGFAGPLVLYLGRLNAKKGLDVLLLAMQQVRAQVPAARLAIVGGGDPPEFVSQVKAWMENIGLQEAVTLTGPVVGDETLEALADADVFALASHAENFSFATFEAMAAQVPVVIADTLNFASEIAYAGAGYSVPRTPEAFARRLVEILETPQTRAAMGARGAQLASRYAWHTVGKHVELTIQTLLANQMLPRELTRVPDSVFSL